MILPKQTDIDKILEIKRKKVLNGTHLPLTIKEIQAGYLNSSYLQRHISLFGAKQIASKKGNNKKSRGTCRKIYNVRLFVV